MRKGKKGTCEMNGVVLRYVDYGTASQLKKGDELLIDESFNNDTATIVKVRKVTNGKDSIEGHYCRVQLYSTENLAGVSTVFTLWHNGRDCDELMMMPSASDLKKLLPVSSKELRKLANAINKKLNGLFYLRVTEVFDDEYQVEIDEIDMLGTKFQSGEEFSGRELYNMLQKAAK